MSKIEWTGETMTGGVYGCEPISPGCRLCWSARLASTRHRHLPRYAGLAEGGVFNGTVRVIPEEADAPLHMRKPRLLFVTSNADLFHHLVPAAHVARLVAAMIASPQHEYQVLTKRAARMSRMLQSDEFWQLVSVRLGEIWGCAPPAPLRVVPEWIWIGVSVEDETWARRRIPALQRTPALTRWLSVEPLLDDQLDLTPYLDGIHWVVVGGETGKTAKPVTVAAVRAVREACTAAGVALFFKQWGDWCPDPDQLTADAYQEIDSRLNLATAEPFPMKVGKRLAGDHLDDRQWHDFPRPVPVADAGLSREVGRELDGITHAGYPLAVSHA